MAKALRPAGGSARGATQLGALLFVFCSGCQALNDPGQFVIFGLKPDAGAQLGADAESSAESSPQSPGPDQAMADCRTQPAERRCSGDVPERCASTGEWELAGPRCPFGCREGLCLECAPGSYQCSAEGIPEVCDEGGVWLAEASCPAGQLCVPAAGSCGECSEGELRFCVGQLGNCSAGQQRCLADLRWGPCSVQPREDSCSPGDDGNCDGVPNTPSTGACTCVADVTCGPATEAGECAFGISRCADGALGACAGAVSPQARDCRSSLDRDCDGQPDNQTCECPVGDTRSCGSGPCPGRQTCLLSSDASSTAWGPCEAAPLGGFQAPELVTGLDVSEDLWGPALSADGLTLLFGADSPESIFTARRASRGAPFAPATELSTINTSGNEGTPFLSADGLTLYFYGIEDNGGGDRDIQFATRPNAERSFRDPESLDINTLADEQNPWLSPDELQLVFDSDRDSGEGSQDLWLSRRGSRSDHFEAPQSFDELNTSAVEEGPALSNDGLQIFFGSNRSGGQGNLDIWFASRRDAESEFSAPQNLEIVNSAAQDLDPALSADGSELFFSSSRAGSQQLYRSVRSCE